VTLDKIMMNCAERKEEISDKQKQNYAEEGCDAL
jgi:hypothetical protein